MESDANDSLQLSKLSAIALADFLHYTPTPPPRRCPSVDILEKCLRDVFHLPSFRPLQLDAVRAIIEGRDCFIRMATGSGKSLLWQLPAACQPGESVALTVVICPTISLIMDQMRRLCTIMSPSFMASCYYGDLPRELQDHTLWLLSRPNIQPHCLLLTPDQLSRDFIKSLLVDHYKSGHLARFVIDEADKFLTWGKTFYTEYHILQDLRKMFPKVPIVAMTASITVHDMDTCIKELGMQNCAKFTFSLDRPNLCYEVKQKHKNTWDLVNDVIDLTREGPGIIYCTYTRETKMIAASLRNKGINAQAYYGQLQEIKKRQILNKWKRDQLAVVVATAAFGMGIDKHNVRWIVHDTMPSSIEGWFQESGRAGRDGKPASCIIYFQIEDYCKVKKLIAGSTKRDLPSCLKPLHGLMNILLDKTSCRRQQLMNYFGEKYTHDNCGACDFCRYGRTVQWSKQNVTVDAQNALNLLEQMHGLHRHWTEKQLAQAIFGEKNEKFKKHGVMTLKGFGCGFPLTNGRNAMVPQIQELIQLLIQKGVIMEYKHDYDNIKIQYYIEPRIHAKDIVPMELDMNLPISSVASGRAVGLKGEDTGAAVDLGFKVAREFDAMSKRMVDIIVIEISDDALIAYSEISDKPEGI